METADTAHNQGPSAFAQAAELELRSVSKRYPGQSAAAISDLSLTVPAGEVCVLVGPSGSGKTTAMRLINRMVSLSSGDILLGGRSVLQRNPRDLRREIGYVIQQIGLFPHLTVGENIATVPRLLGWDKPRTTARVEQLLELIDLPPAEMRDRYPAQLSGGQRQRVGVARALAADPPLMLMDEPFGAIDPINRARLQDEFLSLQAKVRKTIVFVTHDIDEAIKMGDRIAILRSGGVLAQYDTPAEILTRPADDFVAEFVGADRALKRLSLATLADIDLIAPNGLRPNNARLPLDSTVRDALSMLLTGGGAPLTVVHPDDRVAGLVTIDLVAALLKDDSAPAANGAAPDPGRAVQAPPGAVSDPDGAVQAHPLDEDPSA
ncbi:MAG TPA: ABC transporter ATP-binding protein [Solirubrobacteraceae bacterium]|nr:ABC transporter ATP-binding protein [Solirubrobacteraceae bacterium]